MLVAIGLNSAPLFLLLAINHSVAKVALFLLCGNIIQSNGSSEMHDIRGLVISNPLSSVLLVLGTLAVTGAPPFGAFSAEWMMLTKLGQSHLWLMLSACVCALTLSFLAIFMHVGKMLVGMPKLTEVALGGRSEMQTIPANLIPAALLLVTVLSGLTALPQFIW
jgi:hydrogenase-4 component F